jgi:hypothetical protein
MMVVLENFFGKAAIDVRQSEIGDLAMLSKDVEVLASYALALLSKVLAWPTR